MKDKHNSETTDTNIEDQDVTETSAEVEETDGTEEETKENSAEETKETKSDTVSLAKYMKLKKKYQKDISKEKETDSKLSDEDVSELKKLREERQQKEFEQAFDNEFNKIAELYPEAKDKRDVVLNLSLTDKFKDNSIEEIIQENFKDIITKPTTEDDTGTGGDGVDEKIDFQNATPEQLEKVMEDPKARSKYIDWKVEQA